MSGPPPTPTTLKILRGNPGRRPLNKKEPKPKKEIPTCPVHLCPIGKKEWKRVSKELITLGLLTKIDRAALAGYCTSWAKYVDTSNQIKIEGMVLTSNTGILRMHPLVIIQNRAMETMRSFMLEFGMTPASRSRIAVAEAEEEGNPFDQFYGDSITAKSGTFEVKC